MNPSTPEQKRRSVFLVILFTLIAASAQLLMKSGTNQLPHGVPLRELIVGIVTNVPLIGGLALYGIGSVVMITALKHGELSVLYPLISLSYVWVTIVSVILFHESMNPMKIGGIVVIMAGVAVLGRGSRA